MWTNTGYDHDHLVIVNLVTWSDRVPDAKTAATHGFGRLETPYFSNPAQQYTIQQVRPTGGIELRLTGI
jgi:hypothetical protein